MVTWEKRLCELLLAGGTLATSACTSGDDVPCGNANPDPCICGRPGANSQAAAECDQKTRCEAEGGVYDPRMPAQADGAIVQPHCTFPTDASEDRAATD
jgi:hypothetical protein